MITDENHMREEVENLWVATFGEPPGVRCDARLLIEILVRGLPKAPAYGEPRRPRGPTPQPRSAPSGNA